MNQTFLEELNTLSEQVLHIPFGKKEQEKLLVISEIKMYTQGTIICGVQEQLKRTGFVIKGMVRSFYLDVDGNEITKNFHGKNFFCMDEGLLGYEKSICAYEAVTDCTILQINTKQLKELINKDEYFKNVYIAGLENGMRYKIYRESEFLTKNATERYLQFLKDYPELSDSIKQSHISTYPGITPESLSRIRKALRKDGGFCE